ncbi:hypothetical protein G4Y79_15260 [Phototrophicus methaneseepsis]|uniref:Phage protein n=1 Tax=Phototrophicus methaneseepsis TaxID=2710758 RepID=A0A7S8ID10_9CHLR|nr:hypothetical protein [Phototrophicus methaneseepsis]QPC81061.1 hypothetical protein G4Y79_15260 [Phototrophicus methaneseepsis]
MLTTQRHIVRTARRLNAEGAISLFKRRSWYADENQGNDGSDSPDGQSNGGDGNNTDEIDLSAVPESVRRHYERREAQLKQEAAQRRLESKELSERLQKLEAAQSQQLEEQGNFRALADKHAQTVADLRPYKDMAERYEARFRDSNEKRIAAIPEHMRPLVPTEYSPEKLSDWLDNNVARLTTPKAPDLDSGAGGGSGKQSKIEVTEADRLAAEAATRSGYPMTAEDIAKRRGQG